MSINWSNLTFTPSDEAVQRLAEAWRWKLQESYVPVLFSSLGDMFFQPESGGVWWLNTGTAEITHVADTVEQFRDLLGTTLADEWFMPSLIEKLVLSGKVLKPGQCYTYVTLPVFAEGKYEVDNLNPVSGIDHFSATGHILCEIESLPSGATVKLVVIL